MGKVNLYKVGDSVRIKNTSSYYVDNDSCNPKGIEGTVDEFCIISALSIGVKWDNGELNCYSEKDLELVDSKIVSNVTIVEELKQEVKQEVRPRRRLLI
jgi:hypothetical protein